MSFAINASDWGRSAGEFNRQANAADSGQAISALTTGAANGLKLSAAKTELDGAQKDAERKGLLLDELKKLPGGPTKLGGPGATLDAAAAEAADEGPGVFERAWNGTKSVLAPAAPTVAESQDKYKDSWNDFS